MHGVNESQYILCNFKDILITPQASKRNSVAPVLFATKANGFASYKTDNLDFVRIYTQCKYKKH